MANKEKPKHKLDATAAENIVRTALANQYGDKLKATSFWKCWYSSAGDQQYWDVEAQIKRKIGWRKSEIRNIRYQVGPFTGDILGYQETVPK